MKPVILFVDDELINLFVLEKRFEEDYDVLTAGSGTEAIETIEKNKEHISAVISDLRMPGMDGLELIRTVKADLPKIPFFLLTGYDLNDQIKEALNEGTVNDLFKKPFDYDIIHNRLQASFSGD